MIKNKHQLEITQNSIAGFKAKRDSISNLRGTNKIYELEVNAIDSIIHDLEAQVDEYNKITSHQYTFDTIDSFEQLSRFIIGKRIQKNLDEATIANNLGIDVGYYNWLEENDFYGIDERLLGSLLNLLDIKIAEGVLAEGNVTKFGNVLSNLRILGINEEFLKQAINIDLREVRNLVQQKKSDAVYAASRFIHYFKKVFGLNLTDDFTGINPLEKSLSVAFKKPVNIKTDSLNITTGYAAYVASLVSRKIDGKSDVIKADPIVIRDNLLKEYGEVTLESCADYIWKLKIPLLPIDIKSGFHGACFDFSGVRAIVINQQHRMVSRWKFDLLHELYHALTMDHNFYLECQDREQQLDKDEILASRFANFVVFGSDVETFLKIAVEETGGDIKFLKSILPDVAHRYKLNIDDFSNYAAYRLTMQGLNWWGTAKNLQRNEEDPYDILLEYLVKNLDIDIYSDFERKLIISTFNKGGLNNGY